MSFFYVQSWVCALDRSASAVVEAMGLRAGKPMAFAAATAKLDRDLAFVVEHAGAVFVFSPRLGFDDFYLRLATPRGTAYSIFCDDKRGNILCSLARDGARLRQVGYQEGSFFEEGAPGPGEPAFVDESDVPEEPDDHEPPRRVIHDDDVVALAATWGPDPRALVAAAPTGVLYRWP